MGTTTIYRCDCGHKHLDHEREAGSRCSFGGCECTRSAHAVQEQGLEETVPTWPGYDRETGKWATR